MRYIGNKTRLLHFLGEILDEHDVRGDELHAVDAFAGTASVGRFLKRRGFRVTSCDIMTYSYVLQKSYVELDAMPNFRKLARALGIDATDGATSLASVLRYLESALPPRHSLISREYACANGATTGKRMYFTIENANRIDAVRESLDEWRARGLIDDAARFVLLGVLLEGLDSVANTTGVYAAYVKTWQANAVRTLRMKEPELTMGTGLECRVLQGDVNCHARDFGRVDLLYLDPPYNSRQYSGYYHVPELVARGWSAGEPPLRGKTGLIPDMDKRSDWSRRTKCVAALNALLDAVDARYVLMSYNSEGIIPESEIRDALVSRGKEGTFRVHERHYARYRSDRDREDRRYKSASVTERAYFVELKR